jgi:hypothetical protein
LGDIYNILSSAAGSGPEASIGEKGASDKSGKGKKKRMLANVAAHPEMDGFGVDHRLHHQHHNHNHAPFTPQQPPPQLPMRKRKAEAAPDNNERLSKRMSLLNLGMSILSNRPPSGPVPHPRSSGAS